MLPLLPRATLGVAVLCAISTAQRPIFVVDETGGATADFTDIPAAVAAVPDGAVLVVRSGSYTPFQITGKSLAVVGDDASTVLLSKPGAMLAISGTGVGQDVLLKNITVEPAALSSLMIQITQANGAVVLENVHLATTTFLAGSRVIIDQSTNVQFNNCTLLPPQQVFLQLTVEPRLLVTDSTLQVSYSQIQGVRGRGTIVSPEPGSAGVELVRSRCVAIASTITGGLGSPACISNGLPGCYVDAGDGGPGVVCVASTLIALRATAMGGPGNSYACNQGGQCTNPGDGGAGVEVTAGSVVFFEGGVPLGGVGGFGNPPGNTGTPFVNTGGVIQIDATSTPSIGDIQGVQAVGQRVQFSVDARPQSAALVLLSAEPTLTPLEPLALGSWLSQFSLVLGPFPVPTSGQLVLPFTLPTLYPLGDTFFGQFLTVEPGSNRIWATNSFTLHVNN